MNKRIGIMGLGVVGGALDEALRELKYDGSIVKYDPKLFPEHQVNDLLCCNLVFICVPTPMLPSGEQDASIVEDCLFELSQREYEGVVVIKSTLLPSNLEKFELRFLKLKLVSNPEFLTEAHPTDDLLGATFHVVGGDHLPARDQVADFYYCWWPISSVQLVGLKAAMYIKYIINTHLAARVSAMNEYEMLWTKIQGDDETTWAQIVEALEEEDRLGRSHLQVPGPDGKRGFGGKCFPKDVSALMRMSVMEANKSLKSLVAAQMINQEVRDGVTFGRPPELPTGADKGIQDESTTACESKAGLDRIAEIVGFGPAATVDQIAERCEELVMRAAGLVGRKTEVRPEPQS